MLVTSWNWLFLSDFASFKPTYLPEDNPADFSYFFDTSRKRTCYLAPERFNPDQEEPQLRPEMDIFSAGCVLAELFTDQPLFHFSNLLSYRSGECDPMIEEKLGKIEDPHLRSMIQHMIQRDPGKRFSANEYLSGEKGKSFPGYFYEFLCTYMQIFSTEANMMPDQKVLRINDDLNSLMDLDESGLSLIVSLVTANCRSLKFTKSKLKALECLGEMSEKSNSETILDRILPFVVHYLADPNFARVRIKALQVMTEMCLKSVKKVPLSDANVFPDYIFPALQPLTNDRNELVRCALAKYISQLARESIR